MAPHIQDMPPEGGYQKIHFERIPAKSYFGGYAMIAGYLGITAGACYLFYLNKRKVTRDEIEARSAKIAIYPLLLAERDREFLKQLRRNRDEEEKLMANVDGWEVGTYKGEPIYKTIPKDKFIDPMYNEYYAHSSYWDWAKRAHLKFWT
ncbi:NADH dehydrogenase (Ubiquinone) 1 alpha subcomplex subunit 13 [Gryllus bimaculatus]|nr:NADH dehydrogenase (Ubiquinone) 1 alpha subcomplex subunit 13 [Gryllus bimaculatus]